MRLRSFREKLPPWLDRGLRVIMRSLRDFSEDECALRAAALSYHALLSFFPLLLFLLFIAGVVIRTGGTQDALLSYVERAVPALAEPATRVIQRTIAASASFGLLGAAGLLWTASALFAVLTSTFNVIWIAKPRSLWRRRLIGLLSVLALAILFIFSLLLRTLAAFEVFNGDALARRWINLAADLGVTVILSWILYTWLPNRKIDWRASLSGAVLAALLWQVAKTAFGIYVRFGLERFGAIYGSLGSVIILILWVYFSSLIFFYGAEFAAALQLEPHAGEDRTSEGVPRRRASAAEGS